MRHARVISALCGLAAASTASAQLTITSDFTQHGGFLAIPNGPNQLNISSASNPLLTLNNGANGNAVSRLLIGTQFGHGGSLLLEQNSQMVLNENGPFNPLVVIGDVTGSTGSIRVRTGALLDTSFGALLVGEFGNGTLIVEQGGRVRSPFMSVGGQGFGQGTVLVTGENSRIDFEDPNFSAGFTVGSAGNQGTMIVSDGGVVTATGDVNVGFNRTGILSIFDPGTSVVMGGEFSVGVFGQGTANISNGALLVSNGAFIGERAVNVAPAASGSVTVTGAGTLWSNNGDLFIGTNNLIGPADFPSSGSLTVSNNASVINSGIMMVGRTASGQLNVTGGGTISAVATDANFPYAAVLGFTDTSDGHATISGAGSAMNLTGNFIVGNSGLGTLHINSGGLVTNNDASMAFFQAGAAFATVEGDNSRWLSSGNLYVGGNFSQQDSNFFGGQANLLVRDGGLVRAQGPNGVTIFQNSTLYGAGGTIMGNTVENRGLVIVGEADERGFMTIAGNYRQTATGELNIVLAGVDAGSEYDRLVVTNQAFLDGELSVLVHDTFLLGFNQSFDILTSGSVLTGEFAGLPNNALVGTFNGVELFIRYSEVEGPAGNGGVVSLYTIPAPGSAALLALAGLVGARRRRA